MDKDKFFVMKKFFTTFSILALLLPIFDKAKAEDYKYFKTNASIINNVPTVKLYGVSSFGNETLLKTWESSRTGITMFNSSLEDVIVDQYEGKMYFEANEANETELYEGVLEYDMINNTITKVETTGNVDLSNYSLYPEVIKQIIRKDDSTGVTSIGENSFKLQETSSQMKLWATDSQGRIAPINITNGSKLLINGRDVEQSINNVGALSAALTGLPTVPTETTLACGLGTGTHGGDYAFSGGCASKVNERLSINYAASMTMPGQDYAGDFEDTFSARAGFVWKLGKAIKPTQITMKEGKELKEEIITLKENNQNIISQNKALLARLEKLEKLALVENKSKDLAIYKLK